MSGDRRMNHGMHYTGVERRNAGTGGLQNLLGLGSAKTMRDDDIEQHGLPSVNRHKGNSQLINTLGIITIIGVGTALAVMANSDKNTGEKKKKDTQETIANNLPPLIIPPTPVRLSAVPVPGAAHSQTMTNSGTQPIPLRGNSGPAGKPAPTWQERKMGGMTLVSGTGAGGSPPPSVVQQPSVMPAEDGAPAWSTTGGGQAVQIPPRSELAAKLEPTVMAGSLAGLMPDRNYIVAKGTALDCALETALDSTVPGLTTCRLTRDVYSDNGQVVLLDRGTQLVGEYQGGIKLGQARLFVLWSRAKTPNGIIVTLNSPGTDALGRTGLEGWVDTHFIDRFGAAIMISLLKDTYALLIARQTNGGAQNTIVLGNTAQSADRLAEKALEASVNIPPTLMKNQGDHIQVMLARDLDFSAVYTLRSSRR